MTDAINSSAPDSKKVRAIAALIAAGLIVLTVTALINSAPKPDDGGEVPISSGDRVLAKVNNTAIYESRLETVRPFVDAAGDMSDKELLNHLLDQRLLSQFAAENGINESALVRAKLRTAREQILAETAVKQHIAANVTDEAIAEFYEAEKARTGPQLQVKARQIVLPDYATATEIIRRLDKGDTFASLALAFSIDRASREAGGDLGFMSRDMPDPLLTDKIFSAAPGDRIGPVETSQGWHIIDIVSRRTAPYPSLQDRREGIEALLAADAVKQLLDGLRQNADVEMLPAGTEIQE